MFALSIWPRGLAVNAVATELLKSGGGCLDAIEAALCFAEDDANDHSTGVGGLPNADGEVELDAAIMLAREARLGAVGALRETRYAISVARRVMEKTPHLLLVGEGARAFARSEGFPPFDLLTEESLRRWQEWKQSRSDASAHDTMGTIAIDQQGEFGVGVTTSGIAFKLPGRIGDSAIPGAGLYCQEYVGGALATGRGEEAMRICASFQVVALMRSGEEPETACALALQRLLKTNPQAQNEHLALAALRTDGKAGAASLQPGFAYAHFDGESNRLVEVASLGNR